MVLGNGEFAYSLHETIGVGATGKVKLGVHKETGERVAVKMVSARLFQLKPELIKKVLRECDIMASVAHANVVRFLGKHHTEESLYLVLELVTGGELFDYLLKTGRQTEEQALKFFRQLIDAVHYCHERNVCHRDIKPENLLLDDALNVKVADFGYAQWMRHASDGSGGWVDTSCGSPHYASPEVIHGDRYVGKQADVWSCGVVLFALLTGGLPFDDENLQR
jgi:serine/threonine protein kinase